MKGRRVFDPAGDCKVWFATEEGAERYARDCGVDWATVRKHMVKIDEPTLGHVFEFPATWVSTEENGSAKN